MPPAWQPEAAQRPGLRARHRCFHGNKHTNKKNPFFAFRAAPRDTGHSPCQQKGGGLKSGGQPSSAQLSPGSNDSIQPAQERVTTCPRAQAAGGPEGPDSAPPAPLPLPCPCPAPAQHPRDGRPYKLSAAQQTLRPLPSRNPHAPPPLSQTQTRGQESQTRAGGEAQGPLGHQLWYRPG